MEWIWRGVINQCLGLIGHKQNHSHKVSLPSLFSPNLALRCQLWRKQLDFYLSFSLNKWCTPSTLSILRPLFPAALIFPMSLVAAGNLAWGERKRVRQPYLTSTGTLADTRPGRWLSIGWEFLRRPLGVWNLLQITVWVSLKVIFDYVKANMG